MPRYGIKLASHFLEIPQILEIARYAESLGFHSVWTTEGRMAPDSATLTAAIAATTERVRIGTSVLNPFSRTPGLVAITAASIDRISGGRFVLGIGPGDPVSLEAQNVGYTKPLIRLREYVAVVRDLWAGKTVDFTGDCVRISGLRLDFAPVQSPLPVYVAATGPRALRQAIEVGDGLLLNVGVQRDAVARITETAHSGRYVEVVGSAVVAMDRDREAALRGVKPAIVTYLTRFPAISRISGAPEALVGELGRALSARGMAAACAILPDHQVHRMAAVGTPADCRRWIADYSLGMDQVLLTPAFGQPRFVLAELAGLLG